MSKQMQEVPNEKYVEISITMDDTPPIKYIEMSILMQEFSLEKYVEISINMEHDSIDDDPDETALLYTVKKNPPLMTSVGGYNLVVTPKEPEDGFISWPGHSYDQLFRLPSFLYSPQDYQEKLETEIENVKKNEG